TSDLREALRRMCRELSRITGADTVAAYLADPGRRALHPAAAYRVPKHLLGILASGTLPLAGQAFRVSLFEEGRVVWSDHVPNAPGLQVPPLREAPHQSGIGVPLPIDGQVSGAFYLVWWDRRHRPDEAELATLQAAGQQAGILLRTARLLDETERRRREAETL